ncbi:MFS transporter [Nonomuraea sp. CA-141351]|uniref:MFS transporter n=1 Tax=Nonomuraea sp. CA-141351 TaxID=3239996 RepID=UPI003D89F5DC
MLAAIGASVTLGDLGWHVVMIASAVAGLWAFAVRAWVPESPYWLAPQGRREEARAVLRTLRTPAAVVLRPLLASAEPARYGTRQKVLRRRSEGPAVRVALRDALQDASPRAGRTCGADPDSVRCSA